MRIPLPLGASLWHRDYSPRWALYSEGYLYMADTLLELWGVARSGWKAQRYFIGGYY